MKRRLWTVPIALLLLLQLFHFCALPAPSAAAGPEQPVDGDWLVGNLGAEPGTINPITSTDASASTVQGHIYESLITRDEKTLEMKPELAESWEVAEDHMTYTFHLRKDVRWHDGRPFTAKDVVFSFERINDPKVDAAHLRNYYQDIESIEAVDDYTIRYKYRTPYFRALQFCGGIPIVPAHLFKEDEDFNKHPIARSPVGTGPYRFLRWDTGKEIVLVRNEDYWGEKPHIMRIVYKIITEQTVSLQVLKKGGLDINSLLPIQWVKQTQSPRFQEEFRKLKYYQPMYRYVGWNLRKPLFSDKRVRRAMTMLMNRRLIVDKILFGLGTVVNGTFYINSPEYNKDIEPYPYDPKAAVELLKSAGWEDHDKDGVLDKDGTRFEFEFLFSAGNKIAEQVAVMLQEDLKQVGINMSLRKLEWAVFIQQIQGHGFDACLLGWSLGWESDPYQIWHSSQAEKGSNFVGFQNEEADRLIETARREFDPQKRIKLYHRFSEILHEEQPYSFLFTTEQLTAVSKRFHNVNVYPLGLYSREWWVPLDLQRYH